MTIPGWVNPAPQPDRAVAAELLSPEDSAPFAPIHRQGIVVSNDYTTTPPTCTVQVGNSSVPASGVRYMQPYAPVAGDVVVLESMPKGDLWVVGKMTSRRGSGTHSVRYRNTLTPTLVNGAVAFIGYSVKDTNGLNEPEGAMESGGAPWNTFTIPFDDWWEIEPTISWDTTVNGVGLQIQTSVSKIKSNINGGAVLVDPIMTLSGRRWLAAGTLIKIQWANVTGATRTLAADDLTHPCDLIFTSRGNRGTN
jgi:hypothetical protein